MTTNTSIHDVKAVIAYPNEALADICKQLMDDYGLTQEQIVNLALDIPGECENINENRAEAYWTDRNDQRDDSSYRRDIINAGRGHLLK